VFARIDIVAGTLLVIASAACASNRPVDQVASPSSAELSPAEGDGAPAPDGIQRFPDVVGATATNDGDTWTFEVTISSPYDSPDRYADAWRVLAPDGTELAVRELTHDHANEQPFTRSLSGVEIPVGIETVTIQGRDSVNGWGGATFDVAL
jgi:hypothetical protein